ncbi:MAG: hypothetical protein RIS92_1166 [Verrucomicrobiota bacterium]
MIERLIGVTAIGLVCAASAMGQSGAKADLQKGSGIASSEDRAVEPQPMQIQAEGGMRLEQAKGYGRFFGGVILISPMDGVVMNAKELEVYFEAAPEQGAGEKEKKGGDVRAKAPDSKQEKVAADGLRQVVATGEVAIVQERKRADGVLERSVAKAHRAVYEASSGNVTLTGWPQVKNGENVVSALSEDTVIVMNEKGVLDVQGKAKGAFVRDASGLKKSEKAGATGGRAQ